MDSDSQPWTRDVENVEYRLEQYMKKKRRNYGNDATYNYITNKTEIINQKQFTDDQRDRLVRMLEDNEKISKILNQLSSDTMLYQMAHRTMVLAYNAQPLRTGPWPYLLDHINRIFDNLIDKTLTADYMCYKFSFTPVRYVGDLQDEEDDKEGRTYTIIDMSMKLSDYMSKALSVNGDELRIMGTWKWKERQTEDVSGTGTFQFKVSVDEYVLVNDKWEEMLMYDYYSWTLQFNLRTKVVAIITDEKENPDIEWSTYILKQPKYKSMYAGAWQTCRSTLNLVDNPANYKPPVITMDTKISDILEDQNKNVIDRNVVPEAHSDLYCNFTMGIGLHPTSMDWLEAEEPVDFEIFQAVLDTDMEEQARYDAMQVCKLQELAYQSQVKKDQDLLDDLIVGIDSGIITNIGSQIATISDILSRTIVYEPMDVELLAADKSEWVPGILLMGDGEMIDSPKWMEGIFDAGFVWYGPKSQYGTIGYSWTVQGETAGTVYPIAWPPESYLSRIWPYTRLPKREDPMTTFDMEFDVGEYTMIVRFNIAFGDAKVVDKGEYKDARLFQFDMDGLVGPGDNRTLRWYRAQVASQYVSGAEYLPENIHIRSRKLKFQVPSTTVTIQQMFLVVPNTVVEPIMVNMNTVKGKLYFCYQSFDFTVVSASPGEYDRSDGSKLYGFYLNLNNNNFTNTNSDKTIKGHYAEIESDGNIAKEKLEFDFKADKIGSLVNLNQVTFTTAMNETLKCSGGDVSRQWVGEDGVPGKPKIITTRYHGDMDVIYEPYGATFAIDFGDEGSIEKPKDYVDIYYKGKKYDLSEVTAGLAFETIGFHLDEGLKLEFLAPRPPAPQDQLIIFNEMIDEVIAALLLLYMNWLRDHNELMGLIDRVDRLEDMMEELQAAQDLQFWLDLVGAIISLIPGASVGDLISAMGNKLSKGFKAIFKRRGNGFSRRVADSFSKSKWAKISEIPEVATELVSDLRVAEQTMKDVVIIETGVPRKIAYQINEAVEQELDIFEHAGKAAWMEQTELLKVNVVIRTGLPDAKVLENAIADKTYKRIFRRNGASELDYPLNKVQFYTVPLGLFGERAGDFFFKFSKKAKNKFDQAAADTFTKFEKRPLHAYTRSEVYMPNPTNKGIICDVTYAGVSEGLSEVSGQALGAITFRTDVVGKLENGYIMKLRPYTDSGLLAEEIRDFYDNMFGYVPSNNNIETVWETLWVKMNRRDGSDAHLYYEHAAPDPWRVKAIASFAKKTDWNYNLLFNNCQTFNRLVFDWVTSGKVPNGAYSEMLLRAYMDSLTNDARVYLTGVVASGTRVMVDRVPQYVPLQYR